MKKHRSKRLTEEAIGTADLIIPMTRRQERKILTTFPSAEGKIRLLRSFDPLSNHPDVKDPWEPLPQKMEKVYHAIYPAVLGLINRTNDHSRERRKSLSRQRRKQPQN